MAQRHARFAGVRARAAARPAGRRRRWVGGGALARARWGRPTAA